VKELDKEQLEKFKKEVEEKSKYDPNKNHVYLEYKRKMKDARVR
jgi:hypothetical protein